MTISGKLYFVAKYSINGICYEVFHFIEHSVFVDQQNNEITESWYSTNINESTTLLIITLNVP